MLNTALRRQDVPTMYKFHFFIKDLHTQLEQLYNLYKPSLETRTFTVYRGLGMPMKSFDETIRQEVNNLLAFDGFLSTSLKMEVAKDFALNRSNKDDEAVILQIEVDADKLERPFADISRLSALKIENEILFSIGTVFRIDDVAKEKTSDGIWLVRLSSINEDDEQLKIQTSQIQATLCNFFKLVLLSQEEKNKNDKQKIGASCANIASTHFRQGEYSKSLNLYQQALKHLLASTTPDQSTVAMYQSNCAMVCMALKKYDDALDLYKKALQIRLDSCQPNNPLLINTLHTMGDIYRQQNNSNQALVSYRKALEMQPTSTDPSSQHDPSSLAATHFNIGMVYFEQKSYENALDNFLKALNYQREHLSENHPVLAYIYNNIGTMYFRQHKFNEALTYHIRTLHIEEHSLPKDHPTFAETYHNIATDYEQLEKYDDAIAYAEKTVNQLRQSQPQNEPEVTKKNDYLERLRKDKQIYQPK